MVKRILRSKVMSWISLLIGLVATVFILMLLILQTDFFAHNTGRMLSRYFFRGTPFSLRVEKLSGNPFKEIQVRGLSIRYQGMDFSFDILRIDEIRCKYDIFSLMAKDPVINELVMIDPHLWIKPDTSGVIIIPPIQSGGGGSLPEIEIRNFLITGGQVILQGEERADAVKNVAVKGAVHVRRQEVLLSIEEACGEDLRRNIKLGRLSGDVRWMTGRGRIGEMELEKRRLFLSGLSVELEESRMKVDGVIDPDSMTYHLTVKSDPLVIEEIAKASGVVTSHFGELEGRFIVKGAPGSVTVTGLLNGVFSGFALSGLRIDLDVGKSRIEINSCEGILNGAMVMGGGFYSYNDPEVLHLSLDVREMNLSEGFIPETDVPDTDFNGTVNFTYNLSDDRILFSLDLGEGHFREFPFEHAVIRGSYERDTLFFDDIVMADPSHTVNSNGIYADGGFIRFYINLECTRDDTLFSYFDIERYRADIKANGILDGSVDTWSLRSSGTCANFAYNRAMVPSGDMKLAIMKEDSYRVMFDLSGDSCFTDPLGFSGIELSLEYYKDVTVLKNVHLRGKEIDAEIMGEIESKSGLTKVSLSEVSLTALGEEWMGGGRFTVALGDSLVWFDDLQLHSRAGAIFADLELDEERNNVKGRLRVERLGLQLLNRAGLVSPRLEGQAKGTVHITGNRSDPDVYMNLVAERVCCDTLIADSLVIAACYSGGTCTIDSLEVAAQMGRVRIEGDVKGIRLDEIARGGARAMRGAIVDIESNCEYLYLQPVLTLWEENPIYRGIFTGTVTLEDTLAHPSITVNGTIDSMSVPLVTIPSIDISAKVGGGTAELSGTVDILHGEQGSFSGRFPVLRGDWMYLIDHSQPISLRVDLPEGDVGALTGMTDIVADGSGLFKVGFDISGNFERPVITGELQLDDASFRLSGMEERFHDVDALIFLDDSLITIGSLRGREGKKGSIAGHGSITLRGWRPYRYSLSFDVADFTVASIPDIMAVASGQLIVRTHVENARSIPVLSGYLVVNRAEVYYDLGDLSSEGRESTLTPPSWIAAIDLDLPGNTWLKTPDANVEMQGKISVHHNRKGTYLRGELKLLRGWYNIYNNKFRVRSGKLQFVQAEGFRPVIDIEAETRDPEGRNIYLDLKWHQDDVEPRLALHHEDPGYSETDIWKMLGGGVIGSSNGNGSSWDAFSTAQNLAANYIERMLNSQMQGVTIELESMGGMSSSDGAFEEKETMIAVGKYLSQGLYVKYKQGLSITSARQIEVEYRISSLFLIRSEIIKHSEKALHGKSLISTDEINVDVKLRWEF